MESNLSAFVPLMLEACRAQFPRTCGTCGSLYPTFRSFVERTRSVGEPRADPAEDDPMGLLYFANCTCGSTLTMAYEDLTVHHAFNVALAEEARRTQRSLGATLIDLVATLHDAVRAEPIQTSLPRSRPHVGVIDPMLLEVGSAIIDWVTRKQIRIPPYPAVAFRIQEMLRRPSYGLDELAEVVVGDQALAAAALQRVNSAYYRRQDLIVSLPMAITRLGAREVEHMALASCVGAHARSSGPLSAARGYIWNQSLTTAVICKHLGALRGLSPDESFTCGLLHDLGSMVTALNIESYLTSHPSLPAQPLSWWMHLIDRFHVEVGAVIAEQWQLPPLVSEVMRLHHRTDSANAGFASMVEVVKAADAVAHIAQQTNCLTEAHLESISELLTKKERAVVAEAFPECPALIATFEGQRSGRPGLSKVTPPPQAAVGKTVRVPEELVANALRPAERYRITYVTTRTFTIEGPVSMRESFLAQLNILVETPFTLWATVASCKAVGSLYQMDMVPFALDPPTDLRWQQVIERCIRSGSP
jgi:putative nucleotidyltransferase with HDIG domain